MYIYVFACSGAKFLTKNFLCKKDGGRCYFQVTADGKPIKTQRKLFTECFYVMAMAELGRATNIQKYKV
jgi:N-acylglucosamine 2-epimerase